MQDPYLIQTLEAPAKSDWHHKAAMVFGGGMLQIGDEAWKLLRHLCSFHYMGAAEFEFGAIPKCLSEIAKAADSLVAFSFIIKSKDVPLNYNQEHKIEMMRRAHNKMNRKMKEEGMKTKRFRPPLDINIQDKTVYVLCRKGEESEAERIIRGVSKNQYFLKRGAGFREALDPVQEWDKRKLGWLDMNNEFFFFIDEEMWQGFVDLFKKFLPDTYPANSPSVVQVGSSTEGEEPSQDSAEEENPSNLIPHRLSNDVENETH